MKKYLLSITAFVFSSLIITACSGAPSDGNKQTEAKENAQSTVAEISSNAESADIESDILGEREILDQISGEMDLTGSWDDEISRRASMDIEKNEDGSYNIYIHWGASASETAIWEIHGSYDPVSGMLTYEDGIYSIHSWDDQDNETVSDEETTSGSLMKEGEKLRWKDSKNSSDGLFVKVPE